MADINKTINIDINVENNNLDKAAQGVEKITKATDSHTKSLEHNKKGVLDNGGAMGLLGAATGGLAMDFKDAIEAIEGTGISLKGLRGAIIATGIGALAIILLELITNWEKWSGVIDGSTSKLEGLTSQMDALNVAYADLTYTQQTIIDFMELEGASLDEIAEKREENFKKEQALLISQLELQKEIALTAVESAAMWSRLTNGLLGDWDKVKEAQDKVSTITKQITKLSDDYYKVTKKADNDAVRDSKASTEKRLANEKALNDKLLAFIKNRSETNIKELEQLIKEFDKINESISNLDVGKYGEVYEELKTIFDLYKASQKNIYESEKKIEELNEQKRYASVGEQKILDDKVKTLQKELDVRKEGFITIVNPQLKKEIELVKERATEQIKANHAERNSYAENNDLLTEEMILLNKMSQDDSMRKKDLDFFKEKNEDINRLYEIRQRILSKTSQEEIDSAEKMSSYYDDTQKKLEEQQEAFGKVGELMKKAVKEGSEFSIGFKEGNVKDLINKQGAIFEMTHEGITIKMQDLVKYQDAVSNLFGYEVNINKLTVDERQKVADYLVSLDDKMLSNQVNISKANTDLAKANSDAKIMQVQLTADKEIEISQNTYTKLNAQDEARIQHKQDMLDAEMNLADSAAGLLSVFAEDSEDLMRASIIADSAIGIGKMIISNNLANIGALATPQAILTSGVSAAPIIAMNNIATGVGIAANIAATVKALSKVGGGSADSGAAAAGSAPQAKFNIVGSSSSNQLAATIAAQQQQPVKAYVVGTDMTTQQALDRNIQKNATFL